MSILEKTEMLINAAGRIVPELVNGRPEVPYKGVGKYVPPDANLRLRSAQLPSIPRMETSTSRISKPRCVNAVCAIAWSSLPIITSATATESLSWHSKPHP
jgi:hypothetical protein